MSVAKTSEPWVRISLVQKMTCVAAMTLAIMLGVVLAASYGNWRQIIREQIHARLSVAAAAHQKTVQTQVALLRQRATLTADRGSLQGFLLENASHPDTPQRAWAQTILDRISDGKPVLSARLADTTGRVLLASDPVDVGRELANDSVFQAGLSGSHLGPPGWVGTHLESTLSAPVRRFPENIPKETIGVLMLTADVTPLAEALNDKTGLGASGEVLLVIGEGGRIHIPFSPQHREMTSLSRASAVAIADMVAAKEGLFGSHDFGGTEVIAVGKPIGFANWGLVAKMDASEAYAPIGRALKIELILGCSVAAAGIFAAYGMARGFTRPIRRLTQAARMVTEGDVTARVPVRSPDELGLLSTAFNEMTARLESSIAAASIELAERERAEAALRQSEARFSKAFQSNPGAMCIATVKDGRFIEVNERYCQLFSHTREELIGRTALDLALWGNPAERALLVERLHACGSIRNHVTHFRRKKGDLVHALISMELIDFPGEREPVLVSMLADITERKLAEDKLASSQAQLQAIFDYAPDGIVIADPDSYYLDANASICRMLGYTSDELIGLHASDIVVQTELPLIGEALRVIKTGSDYQREWLFRRKDGSVFAAEVIVTMTPNGNLLGMIRDITERKRADAALREAEREKELAFEASRLKSEFLANMSHELRTPLNCIIGFTEFLVDEKPGPLNPKQKEYLTDVHNSSTHLLQLINDVLDLAKVEAGKIDLNPETFPLAKAIEEVCAVVKGIAQKKGVSVASSVAPDLDSVTLDEQKFKQVCYNLLANAVKFTDSDGAVEINVLAHGMHQFEVRVKDTGIGIKQEDLNRLFREFEQLEAGATRRFEGTGLGLALTKKIVESQGGSIGVESEYGKGSTFFVVMPLVITEAKEYE